MQNLVVCSSKAGGRQEFSDREMRELYDCETADIDEGKKS
jgi:hypothetical protein